MIFSNLKKHSQYKDEVLKEIESAFGYDDKQSFEVDFYHLIKEENLENCHILLDEQRKLVAHIGVRPVTLHYSGHETNVIFLGGIVTLQKYQGKGHFKQLYEYVVQKYENDYSLTILWSDQAQFYHKLGYRPFGLTAVLGEKAITPSDIEKSDFHKVNKLNFKKLVQLYEDSYKNVISVKRSNTEWNDMEKITSTQIYIKGSKEEVESYLFFEKGQDLKGIIHECSFVNNQNELLKFDGLQFLTPFKVTESNFYIHLAYGKILNHELFCKFINNISPASLKLSYTGSYRLQINGQYFKVNEEDLLQVLFGPQQAVEIAGLLPPIYISGADSI